MLGLRELAAEHGLVLKQLVEVGTFSPGDCQLADFIAHSTDERFLLIEPVHEHYQAICGEFGHLANVHVVNCAIYKHDGAINLRTHGASTFVDGIRSPAVANEGIDSARCDAVLVPCYRFSHFDDGQIDALVADVEGCEIYILEHMVSRPKLICLETHGGPRYRNPFIAEIDRWMAVNDYVAIHRDASDTAFVRR